MNLLIYLTVATMKYWLWKFPKKVGNFDLLQFLELWALPPGKNIIGTAITCLTTFILTKNSKKTYVSGFSSSEYVFWNFTHKWNNILLRCCLWVIIIFSFLSLWDFAWNNNNGYLPEWEEDEEERKNRRFLLSRRSPQSLI